MKISWKNDNTIVTDTNSGKIIFDPKIDNLSTDDQKDPNTVLTFSSESLYESTKGKIVKESKTIFGPGEYEFGKIGLKGVAHGNPETKDESTINNIIVAECENLSICHLGNLNLMLSTSLIAQNISGVDILFILAYCSFLGERSFLVPFLPISPIPIMVISSSNLGKPNTLGKHIGRTRVCLYDRLNASESVIRAIS